MALIYINKNKYEITGGKFPIYRMLSHISLLSSQVNKKKRKNWGLILLIKKIWDFYTKHEKYLIIWLAVKKIKNEKPTIDF